MKQFIKFKDSITKYFTKIWWILQGGFISIWGMLGILNKHDKIDIEILFTGLILIALAVTKSNRKYNMRILAQIGLICYTIITSIIIAYPKLIAFVILLIIGVSNILISIIDSFKTFLEVNE